MQFHRIFIYKLEKKKDTAGELFRRVREFLGSEGIENPPVLFYLEDMIGGTSAAARVVKKFPALGALSIQASHVGSGSSVRALTNLGPGWDERHPAPPEDQVSLEVLAQISAGVPRSYPFMYSNFLFPLTPWSSGSGYPDPAVVRSSRLMSPGKGPFDCIIVTSHWWTSGRDNALYAVVRSETEEKKVPPPSEQLMTWIEALGKVKSKSMVFEKEPAKPAEAGEEGPDASEGRYPFAHANRLRQLVSGMELPHAAAGIGQGDISSGPFIKFEISPKKILTEVFKPLGFKYMSKQSGQGVYFLAKKTVDNNYLAVIVDRGSWSMHYSADLLLVGPGWRESMSLPLKPNISGGVQYSFTDSQSFQALTENAAAVIKALETTLIPELESQHDPAPEGFEPFS